MIGTARTSAFSVLGAGILGGMALLALSGEAFAQGGFAGLADPAALDTLSGASTGPGGGAGYVDRARGVAANDPFADPFGGGGADPFGGGGFAGGGADPFGGGGFAGGGDPFGGGGFAGGGDPFGGGAFGAQPGQQGFQAPQIPKVEAVYGTRVVCRVTGQMLDDAVKVRVLDTFRDTYYDDGKTGMDYKANDFVYTNVTLRDDVMSPEAHLVMTRIIQGLRSLEAVEPNDFFNVLVASTDPLAGVPQMVDLERDRDEKLGRWAEKFLQDFRVDPSESDVQGWDFYETYMPTPPLPPLKDIPAAFFPPNADVAGGQGQNGGPGGNGVQDGVRNAFGANNIPGNDAASSSYFGGAGGGGGK